MHRILKSYTLTCWQHHLHLYLSNNLGGFGCKGYGPSFTTHNFFLFSIIWQGRQRIILPPWYRGDSKISLALNHSWWVVHHRIPSSRFLRYSFTEIFNLFAARIAGPQRRPSTLTGLRLTPRQGLQTPAKGVWVDTYSRKLLRLFHFKHLEQ